VHIAWKKLYVFLLQVTCLVGDEVVTVDIYYIQIVDMHVHIQGQINHSGAP